MATIVHIYWHRLVYIMAYIHLFSHSCHIVLYFQYTSMLEEHAGHTLQPLVIYPRGKMYNAAGVWHILVLGHVSQGPALKTVFFLAVKILIRHPVRRTDALCFWPRFFFLLFFLFFFFLFFFFFFRRACLPPNLVWRWQTSLQDFHIWNRTSLGCYPCVQWFSS